MDLLSMVGAHADGPGPWFPLVWIGVMIVFWTASRTRSGWKGFTMKSLAPAWIDSITIDC